MTEAAKACNSQFEWRSDIDSLSAMSMETIQFFLNQSEKALEASITTKRALDDKAARLVNVVLTLFSYLIAVLAILIKLKTVLFDDGNQKVIVMDIFEKQVICCAFFAAMVFLGIAFYLFVSSVQPCDLAVPGNDPKKIMRKKFIEAGDNLQTKRLIFSEAQTYQQSIGVNNFRNRRKARKINWGIWFLLISVIVVAGCLLYLFRL